MLRAWVLAAGFLVASIIATAAEPLVLEVARAQVSFDARTSEPTIAFTMTESSMRKFADFTARNVGRTTELRVDGRVVMKPVIREPILGGAGQIAGGFKFNEAKDIADRLTAGTAKLEVEVVPD
jgi:preprotein translocase subunit SecD